MESKPYFIYILRCENNSLYTGIALNYHLRIKEHYTKSKKAAKYTKAFQVTHIEAIYIVSSKGEALKVEALIKKLSKAQKEALLKDVSYLKELYDLKVILNETTLLF
ncbi:MAG: GIY-YIG nuclease family protein [Bacilli bacterium]